MTRRPRPDLHRDVIERLAADGLCCREIGRRLGCRDTLIYKRLRAWGLSIPYWRHPVSDREKAYLRGLSDGGRLTAREIAERMSAAFGRRFTVQTIQRWQRRLGLDRAPRHAPGFRGVRWLQPIRGVAEQPGCALVPW